MVRKTVHYWEAIAIDETNKNTPKLEPPPDLSGAGGSWPIIDEIADPTVVRQQNNLSCAPACGEMLLQDCGINDITQMDIANETGVPTDALGLARALNILDPDDSRQWIGGSLTIPGATESQLFDTLNETGTWGALLKEWRPGIKLSHVVIVDGIDDRGKVLIRDPWEGTRYKMTREDFLNYWTTNAIFQRKRQ